MLRGFKDIIVAETTGHPVWEVPLQSELSPRLRILVHDSPPGRDATVHASGEKDLIPHAPFVI